MPHNFFVTLGLEILQYISLPSLMMFRIDKKKATFLSKAAFWMNAIY